MSPTIEHLFDLPLAASALATVGSGYQSGCTVENRIAVSMNQPCNSQRSLAEGAKPSHLFKCTTFMASCHEQCDLLDADWRAANPATELLERTLTTRRQTREAN
ncbi:MAG: hypothetical protein R3C20_15750 [Planctomycetaceae bacterium]